MCIRDSTSSTKPIKVSVRNFGSKSNLPTTGLYVINKGKDYIGLTTFKDHAAASVAGFSTGGFFFRSFEGNGDSRDWKYSLEAVYTKQTARIERITANVMTGAPWEGTQVTKESFDDGHLLVDGDEIKLTVESNQSVGIGTSTAVRVKYNSENDKLVINPTTFAGSAVLAGNIINLTAHGLETGDKVFYDGGIVGLSTNSFYVYRLDDDKFQLGQTRYDVLSEPPTIISITAGSGGSGQQLSKVNPRLEVIDNNNLVFDVSDSSLSGYNLRIYHDEEFNNAIEKAAEEDSDMCMRPMIMDYIKSKDPQLASRIQTGDMKQEDQPITFEDIKSKTGLSEGDVIKIMRRSLKPSSFRLWRKRAKGQSIKHRKKFEETRKEIRRKIKKNDYI